LSYISAQKSMISIYCSAVVSSHTSSGHPGVSIHPQFPSSCYATGMIKHIFEP